MHDYYATLGISPDASPDLVKSAYRKKAGQYHPDKNPSPDAATRFREVQEAYDILADATKRRAYDDHRQRSLLDDPAMAARDIWKNYLEKAVA